MKKYLILLVLFYSIYIYADIYKDEAKKIAADRKRVEEIEKKLSKDEKACENPSQNDLSRNVVTELKLYCEARESAKSRIPDIKNLLAEYESLLKNYLEECKSVDTDDKYSKCETLDRQVATAAEKLNDEKENFNSDIDTMENAAERAKDYNARSNDEGKKDFIKEISANLNAKKELVSSMQKGLEEDSKVFKDSKGRLTQALKNDSPDSAKIGKEKHKQSTTANNLNKFFILILYQYYTNYQSLYFSCSYNFPYNHRSHNLKIFHHLHFVYLNPRRDRLRY